MTKILNSLQTKLIMSFILLIIIITGGTFIFTYGQTKEALLDSTRDDMLQTIGLVSTQFSSQDIQTLSSFQAGQDDSPAYLQIAKRLRDMRSLSPNIINLYIMRVTGTEVSFVLDDLEAKDEPALIGQIYTEPDPRLFDALNNPSVSDTLYTDEWGTFLSGYAPIRNNAGQPAFVVGADMNASLVIERQNFIGNTIYYIMGGAVLVAGVIIGLFSVTIIGDIKKLNKTADEISKGNTNVNVKISRKDEIGELADSFGRMVASLKIMMDVGEQPPCETK